MSCQWAQKLHDRWGFWDDVPDLVKTLEKFGLRETNKAFALFLFCLPMTAPLFFTPDSSVPSREGPTEGPRAPEWCAQTNMEKAFVECVDGIGLLPIRRAGRPVCMVSSLVISWNKPPSQVLPAAVLYDERALASKRREPGGEWPTGQSPPPPKLRTQPKFLLPSYPFREKGCKSNSNPACQIHHDCHTSPIITETSARSFLPLG
jgi:hypothetical protein